MGSSNGPWWARWTAGQRASLVGLATALALMLVVIVVSSDYAPFFHTPRHNPRGPQLPATPIRPTGRTQPTMLLTRPPDQHTSNVIPYIVWGMFAALALLVTILFVTAAVRALRPMIQRLLRRLRALLRRGGDGGPSQPPLPAVLDDVTETVAAGRRRLDLGTPRGAIIDAWLALEEGAAAAGVTPRPSETPAELVIRIIDELDADSRAAGQLSRLYRRARFSSHEIEEADRAAARVALAALESSLRAAGDRGQEARTTR